MFEFTSVVLQNPFTDDEYARIYDQINKKLNASKDTEVFVNESTGSINTKIDLDQDILDKIDFSFKISFFISGSTRISTEFARYTKKSGYTPNVKPHWDTQLEYPGYTMILQMKKTLNWPIYVEDTISELDENEAVIFMGSEQVSYRRPIEFGDDDEIDVLLIRVELQDLPKLDTAEIDLDMKSRISDYLKKLIF